MGFKVGDRVMLVPTLGTVKEVDDESEETKVVWDNSRGVLENCFYHNHELVPAVEQKLKVISVEDISEIHQAVYQITRVMKQF